jgi:hypothetical protein
MLASNLLELRGDADGYPPPVVARIFVKFGNGRFPEGV